MLTTKEIQNKSFEIWQWAKQNVDEIGTPTKGELSNVLTLMYENIERATYIIDDMIEMLEETRPF